ncbi:acyl-CoA synthetase family member 2, mitochondrial [Plakobranchus ocellatus]|uniref:Acyl-CoA synthetase family member 2, mitochondrial n=1 Tax=Plakobranchus ocellatus TaxID=259542 RepID=A0AAV4CSJ9_9GAST|nr:acyl-CoA synthetase family member 2, mitochondrial [Plakobranchus ocellatus]
MSLVSEILRKAEELPEKPAFIFIGADFARTVLTFAEVSCLGKKYAAVLRRNGIETGDVVCNTLANSAERLITQVGTLMAGAVDMNGQICLPDGADFLNSLNDGRAKAVLYDPCEKKGAYDILKGRVKIECNNKQDNIKISCPDVPSLQLMIPCVINGKGAGNSLLEELKLQKESLAVDNGPSFESTFLCTSGSTGFFKLVSFTSQGSLDFGHRFAQALRVTKESVLLNDRRFGKLSGYPSVTFAVGCTRVIIDSSVPQFKICARFFWDVIQREKCTVTLVGDVLLHKLIEETSGDLHREKRLLKSISVAGNPINKSILKAIGTVSETVNVFYASTETSILTACLLTSPNEEFDDFVAGWPMPGVQLKVVDNLMHELPVGHIGEILVKSSLLCSGYINNTKANADTFLSNGWVRLGDKGFFNSKGQICVLGRGKNAIMHGDIVVYPEQLEFRIERCPGVAGTAITGIPDVKRYEEICALLVRQPGVEAVTEEQVRQFCSKYLSSNDSNVKFNALPKYYKFVDALPLLPSGKLDRAACKRLAAELVCRNDC